MFSKFAPFMILDGIIANIEPENKYVENDESAVREIKTCKYSKCNNEHRHNNACCSAKHFKLWLKEKRNDKE